MLGDQPRRHAFERRPGGDHLDHLALGLAHDVDAAARHRAHETLALELRHGLAHRRAADAEIERQLALVEPDVGTAAIDVHRHDDVLQRRIGLALEAGRGVDRLDRDARQRDRRRTGAHGPGWRRSLHARSVSVMLVYNIPDRRRRNSTEMLVDRCNGQIAAAQLRHSAGRGSQPRPSRSGSAARTGR